MTKTIKLGNINVGSKFPTVFMAEIGSYFNGDYQLAKRLVESIIEARAMVPEQPIVLKTEILNDPDICLIGDLEETYTNKVGQVKKENYRKLIERKILALEHYIDIFQLAHDAQLPVVVSVYDFTAADFAAKQGAAALKIASSNIVHVPLIRHAAKLGLPLVIDTGRSTLSEVYRAVDTAKAAGCNDIIVQHSPDGHPALPEAHNLRLLQTYERCFNLPTGLSDHHTGVEMLYMAIALGASVLEKGVHVDPEELDQDISHTMSIDDLPKILKNVYDCWIALGNTERNVRTPIKGVIGSSQRQGLVAKRELSVGDKINLDNIRFAFPAVGIPVENWDLIEGWQIAKSIKAGAPLRWEDVAKK